MNDKATAEPVAKIRTALGLLNSMVNGGEQHSQSSRAVFHEAMNALEHIANHRAGNPWSDVVPTVPGWYWVKLPSGHTECLLLFKHASQGMNGAIYVWQAGSEKEDPVTRFQNCQWCGPIQPPEGS